MVLEEKIYRNYYNLKPSIKINLRRWMDGNVYYPFAQEAIGNRSLFETMHEHRVSKIAQRLGWDQKGNVDFLWIRRYYSEIMMPEGDANNADAHNQLAFYHMSFIQPKIIWEGVNATPYIGIGGTYQGALIQKLWPELAAFLSHYGYPLNGRILLKHKLLLLLKANLPLSLMREKVRWILKRRSAEVIEKN